MTTNMAQPTCDDSKGDDALVLVNQIVAGTTFHHGKWDLIAAAGVLAEQVRKLRTELAKCHTSKISVSYPDVTKACDLSL